MKLLRWVWRLVLVVVILLVLLEVGVRVAGRGPSSADMTIPDLFVSHPLRTFAARPDLSTTMLGANGEIELETDERGLRVSKRSVDVSAPTILAIGDDQTFGLGIHEHETWAGVAEGHLRSQGRAARVVNAGAPGYNAEQVVAWLPKHLEEFHPDLVVWGLYLGNDISGIWVDELRPPHVHAGLLVREDGRPLLGLRTFLHRNSAAYRALLEPRLKRTVFTESEARAAILSGANWDDGFALALSRKEPIEGVEETWTRFEAAFAEAEQVCRSRGAKLVLLLLPAPPQIDSGLWTEIFSRLRLDPAELDLEQTQARLRALAETKGVAVVDPTEALRTFAESTGRLEQKPYSGFQLSLWGHQLVGQHLAKNLPAIESR